MDLLMAIGMTLPLSFWWQQSQGPGAAPTPPGTGTKSPWMLIFPNLI